MINKVPLILEIETQRADREEMIRTIFEATGDDQPFFCPATFVAGMPYKGHVHVFPPAIATGVAIRKILVR
jgi:hypothetical protein